MDNTNPIYTINPLFDFQALCDTDLGLYRLIKKEYYDKSIFKKELFETNDEVFIKAELLVRTNFNPLLIFCKKGVLSIEEMDDLYKQFLDEEYDKIIELSPPTAILSVAAMTNSVKNIVSSTVLCKSENEIKWINKYTDKLNCIISDYKDFNLSKFDTLYIKDIYTLLLFNQKTLTKKNIILSRYNFNLENEYHKIELPIIQVAEKYYKNNKFMLIDPYKNISAPVSEMV